MYHQQRIGYWSQLAILLGLVGGSMIIGAIITGLVIKAMTGVPLADIANVLKDPRYVEAARVAQGLGALLTFGVPALVFAAIINRRPLSYLGFNERAKPVQFLYVAGIMFLALFVGAGLGQLNELIPISKSLADKFKKLEQDYNEQVVAIATMKNFADYIYTLITIALIPAIVEELIFRCSLQQVMIGITKNVFWGILITSILFSIVHISFYGFLTRMFLGLLLGYIFYYSKNAWLNIFAHFFNNAFVVTNMYFLSRAQKLDTHSMDDHYPWYMAIISSLLLLFLMMLFRRESDKIAPATIAGTDVPNAF